MNLETLGAQALCVLTRTLTGARILWLGAVPTAAPRVYFANHTSHGDFALIWSLLPEDLRVRTRPVAGADYWLKGKLRTWIAQHVIHAVLVEMFCRYLASPAKSHKGKPFMAEDEDQIYQDAVREQGLEPYAVFGNINDVPFRDYDGMANVHVKDFLPLEEAFDMNMHILSFDPGASHNIVETHVQEHGAYIYEGQGTYNLDNEWYLTKKEDFLWMGAFSLQAGYGIGREPFSYIYSKDCNRDVEI